MVAAAMGSQWYASRRVWVGAVEFAEPDGHLGQCLDADRTE